MRINKPAPSLRTREGAKAKRITPEQELSRTVLSCMLWENGFYENGQDIAARIKALVPRCSIQFVYALAVEARNKRLLRHVPLLLAAELCKQGTSVFHFPISSLLLTIIQRPDELTEFLAIYWRDGKKPIAAQAKKGLALAFEKFDEYQLAKWNRDGAIKLRDVMRLVHPHPRDREQSEMWNRLIKGELATPDTWEVAISAAKTPEEKAVQWNRLVYEKKLGGLALLRNLRNMQDAGVPRVALTKAVAEMSTARILPFRFIAAEKYCRNASLKGALEMKMLEASALRAKLPGWTVLLVDVSGSMGEKLSEKSDLTRLDAACGVAVMFREVAENGHIFTFSHKIVNVHPDQGFALIDGIKNSQPHSFTYLGEAIKVLKSGLEGRVDRLIVITDEQSHDRVPDPFCRGYMINVASNERGVGYGAWTHIDGFSESVVDFILEIEKGLPVIEQEDDL